MTEMLLENKNAVVFGAAGAVGSAVAGAFAREGAHVFLTGRDLARVQRLAEKITDAGGHAEAAAVDALDEHAVAEHLDGVIGQAGRLDVSFNAAGLHRLRPRQRHDRNHRQPQRRQHHRLTRTP